MPRAPLPGYKKNTRCRITQIHCELWEQEHLKWELRDCREAAKPYTCIDTGIKGRVTDYFGSFISVERGYGNNIKLDNKNFTNLN
ncbi:hypothetical protein CDL12_20465 [Handroanthus impetiginosus]|uniref:Uncharacterized protein n=1 Tax=Handroanthus impetiginosus TaxID=429701 RepID=A0A2G9GNU9_9LAMI|nr:hypothetical protein CDL12_20465 [Handroanthus impetiginosus]